MEISDIEKSKLAGFGSPVGLVSVMQPLLICEHFTGLFGCERDMKYSASSFKGVHRSKKDGVEQTQSQSIF